MDDHEVVAAIAAGDPAGIAGAYDKYAVALYGYCQFLLRQQAGAAEALRDTFVAAATTLGDLREPAQLRSWLYSVAREEGQRRLQATAAARGGDDEDAANRPTDPADQWVTAAHRRTDSTGRPINGAGQATDTTRPDTDTTQQFRAARQPADPAHQPTDTTQQFRAVRQPTDVAHPDVDTTQQFRAVPQPTDVAHPDIDTTLQFRGARQPASAADQPTDATQQFRAVRQPASAANRLIDGNGDHGQAEPRTQIRAMLAELKPLEREAIVLNLGHDLHHADLATALGVSGSQAETLVSHARSQLEKALGLLLLAYTGREACSALNMLLADWDGQLTEQTRNLVGEHVAQCELCAARKRSALRPAALSGLLPLRPPPPELREQVLRLCADVHRDAEADRRRAVRRAESIWFTRFSQAIRLVGWDNIRRNPGVAIATAAVAAWVLAAVSVTLLTFFGSRAAHALTSRPSVRPPSSSPTPATAPTTTTTPTSAPAKPSPTISQAPAVAPPSVQPSALPTESAKPSPAPSHSAKASQSPSPKPSKSPSPSSSPSRSPSPSPSKTA